VTFSIPLPAGGGRRFGTGSISRLRGEQALGFYRLNMTIDFVVEPAGSATEQDPPALTELVAEARIGGRFLGRFVPAETGSLPLRSYPGHSNQSSVTLTCELDRSRVEAIEEARAGGNLQLDVRIQGRFSDGTSFQGDEQHTVNQGVWVEVLAEMGYQRTLLIEVPAPDPHAQPELAKAVDFLAQAQRHLRLGYYRDAVGALRDVLDQAKLAFGDDDTIPPDLDRVLFQNSHSMSKAERLRVLRRALKLVTHPARHRDQVSVAIEWSRTDAAQMITMVAAFINEMSAPDARPSQPASATPQDIDPTQQNQG
jgi:hypothetical protein